VEIRETAVTGQNLNFSIGHTCFAGSDIVVNTDKSRREFCHFMITNLFSGTNTVKLMEKFQNITEKKRVLFHVEILMRDARPATISAFLHYFTIRTMRDNPHITISLNSVTTKNVVPMPDGSISERLTIVAIGRSRRSERTRVSVASRSLSRAGVIDSIDSLISQTDSLPASAPSSATQSANSRRESERKRNDVRQSQTRR